MRPETAPRPDQHVDPREQDVFVPHRDSGFGRYRLHAGDDEADRPPAEDEDVNPDTILDFKRSDAGGKPSVQASPRRTAEKNARNANTGQPNNEPEQQPQTNPDAQRNKGPKNHKTPPPPGDDTESNTDGTPPNSENPGDRKTPEGYRRPEGEPRSRDWIGLRVASIALLDGVAKEVYKAFTEEEQRRAAAHDKELARQQAEADAAAEQQATTTSAADDLRQLDRPQPEPEPTLAEEPPVQTAPLEPEPKAPEPEQSAANQDPVTSQHLGAIVVEAAQAESDTTTASEAGSTATQTTETPPAAPPPPEASAPPQSDPAPEQPTQTPPPDETVNHAASSPLPESTDNSARSDAEARRQDAPDEEDTTTHSTGTAQTQPDSTNESTPSGTTAVVPDGQSGGSTHMDPVGGAYSPGTEDAQIVGEDGIVSTEAPTESSATPAGSSPDTTNTDGPSAYSGPEGPTASADTSDSPTHETTSTHAQTGTQGEAETGGTDDEAEEGTYGTGGGGVRVTGLGAAAQAARQQAPEATAPPAAGTESAPTAEDEPTAAPDAEDEAHASDRPRPTDRPRQSRPGRGPENPRANGPKPVLKARSRPPLHRSLGGASPSVRRRMRRRANARPGMSYRRSRALDIGSGAIGMVGGVFASPRNIVKTEVGDISRKGRSFTSTLTLPDGTKRTVTVRAMGPRSAWLKLKLEHARNQTIG